MPYRKMELVLDEDDFRDIQAEITRRQLNGRDDKGIILPDGESNLAGAVIAEVCRDYRELSEFYSDDLSHIAAMDYLKQCALNTKPGTPDGLNRLPFALMPAVAAVMQGYANTRVLGRKNKPMEQFFSRRDFSLGIFFGLICFLAIYFWAMILT